jgi:uncharacterized membrane protein
MGERIRKRPLKRISGTLLGGIVFLVPVAVIVFVIGKAFAVVLRLVQPLAGVLPIESVGGVAVITVVAWVCLLAVCYGAGMLARSAIGNRVSKFLDSKMNLFFPRYAFIKSTTSSLTGEAKQSALKTVLVTLDDCSQIGFEVERSAADNGQVAVFVPGSPDPWSGSVLCVTPERIKQLDTDFLTAVQTMRHVGSGVTSLLGKSDGIG